MRKGGKMDSVRSQSPFLLLLKKKHQVFLSLHESDTLKLKDGKIQIAPPSPCVERMTWEDQFELVL